MDSDEKLETKYKCSHCDKAFICNSQLLFHMRIHKGIKPYQCTNCNRSFFTNKTLDIHKKGTRRKITRVYTCFHCNKAFLKKPFLRNHMMTHNGDTSYKCSYCGKSFSENITLIDHMKTHLETQYQCGHCDKSFAQNELLFTHIRIHNDEKILKFKCSQCDFAYNLKRELSDHVKSIHNGKTPYICCHCDKIFPNKSNLTVHLRVHTGEKPYKCNQCDKSFSHSTSLKAHSIIAHKATPYVCGQCDKTYSNKNSLKTHLRVHMGEKPYNCTQCDKSFSLTGSLKRHLMTHTGEKPYQYNQSDRDFSTFTRLTENHRLQSDNIASAFHQEVQMESENNYSCSSTDSLDTLEIKDEPFDFGNESENIISYTSQCNVTSYREDYKIEADENDLFVENMSFANTSNLNSMQKEKSQYNKNSNILDVNDPEHRTTEIRESIAQVGNARIGYSTIGVKEESLDLENICYDVHNLIYDIEYI